MSFNYSTALDIIIGVIIGILLFVLIVYYFVKWIKWSESIRNNTFAIQLALDKAKLNNNQLSIDLYSDLLKIYNGCGSSKSYDDPSLKQYRYARFAASKCSIDKYKKLYYQYMRFRVRYFQ